MLVFETLGKASTPDGRQLSLHRRDRDYFIYIEGEELMTSRAFGSEAALAEIACERLPDAERPRVLIGGLGIGFTLRAALDVLPAEAEVVVAELIPEVVGWNREHLGHLTDEPLEDPRTEIRVADVHRVLKGSADEEWDAVMLDVDNGPSAWCIEANLRLYGRSGLDRIRRVLKPGGVLGVWSAYRDAAFVKLLGKSGFDARFHTVRGRGDKGHRHTIFIGRKRGGR
jgi:spermidine synthase